MEIKIYIDVSSLLPTDILHQILVIYQYLKIITIVSLWRIVDYIPSITILRDVYPSCIIRWLFIPEVKLEQVFYISGSTLLPI